MTKTKKTTTMVNTEDNHRKFYIVTVDGPHVTFNWGRIGSDGQFQYLTQRSHVSACVIARDKIYEKLNRGYVVLSRS